MDGHQPDNAQNTPSNGDSDHRRQDSPISPANGNGDHHEGTRPQTRLNGAEETISGFAQHQERVEKQERIERQKRSVEVNLSMELSWANRFLLAKQVRRFYSELGCIFQNEFTNIQSATFRTAYLWMEEFGEDVWPARLEKRGHLRTPERYPETGFVYARDRSVANFVSQEHIEAARDSLPEFCWAPDFKGLNPMNINFENMVLYFKDVFDNLWDFENTLRGWPERTARELFCIIFDTPIWSRSPEDLFCPLFYLHDDRARHCESDESGDAVCECHIR